MLRKLEKEIDDVDTKIGDRWQLLDRFLKTYLLHLNVELVLQLTFLWNINIFLEH